MIGAEELRAARDAMRQELDTEFSGSPQDLAAAQGLDVNDALLFGLMDTGSTRMAATFVYGVQIGMRLGAAREVER